MTPQVRSNGDRRSIRRAPLTKSQARREEIDSFTDLVKATIGQTVVTPPLERVS